MTGKIVFMVMGALVVLTGIITIKMKGFYSYGLFFGFEKSNIFVGLFLILAGLIMIVYGITAKASNLKQKYFKCTKCLQLYRSEELKNMNCPECKGELETLDGFFERHPDTNLE